ncbi:MAG: Fic family protein [Anaerolineae bacterium]
MVALAVWGTGMTYHNNLPYNDLPLLPPRGVETPAVLRRVTGARVAVEALRGAGRLVPNQAILINAIPLQEARLSSEIENIVTTQDALYRAAARTEGAVDPAAREVLRHRTALRQGYEALAAGRRIDIDLMLGICSTLLDAGAELRDEEPIVIAPPTGNEAVYTPPRGRARIVSLLQNLVDFLQAPGEMDPLVRLAIAHYQFEAIHPFADGNGRTGRILNVLALIQAGLLEIPVVYLSRYLIQNKAEYYRRLRAVTEERDWEGWLLYMLQGIEETARWTTGRIEAIRAQMDVTEERVRAEFRRTDAHRLTEVIFTEPYCRIQDVIDAGLAERKTASRYLQGLERAGILASHSSGREVVYTNTELLEVLRA